jgi:wyosine [tRNA(Phe)-imidazoG37] synthetase (radical SAM superfamily)
LVKSWPALQGVPVAVLTNATLLSQPDVRRDLAHADLVAAKLDAPDEALYRAINRPMVSLTWAGLMEGIRAFRDEFHGRLALQMMFIRANRKRVAEMADLARDLKPDHVQLNTPLRSSPTPPLGEAAMYEIEEAFAGLPVINVYRAQIPTVEVLDRTEMRWRRPEEGHPKFVEKEVK